MLLLFCARACSPLAGLSSLCWSMIVKIAWLRLDASFMRVAPVERHTLPVSSRRCMSSAEAAGTSRIPLTCGGGGAVTRAEAAHSDPRSSGQQRAAAAARQVSYEQGRHEER